MLLDSCYFELQKLNTHVLWITLHEFKLQVLADEVFVQSRHLESSTVMADHG